MKIETLKLAALIPYEKNKGGRGYKTQYTRSQYSRGAMRVRDKIWENIVSPKCEICGLSILRKYYENGFVQRISNWLRMKTCGCVFSVEKNKYIPTECMKIWRSIPQNNGRYLGLMHRKCKFCGKMGLSYVSRLKGEKLTESCRKCADEHRIAHNKKDTPHYNCFRCGKECVGRFNGKYRYPKNGKTFCSMGCANKTRELKRNQTK